MSEIRATDLVRVNLAARESHSCEIRVTSVGSYEIRQANLVKANLAASEVSS
jgi:hypothetical protein